MKEENNDILGEIKDRSKLAMAATEDLYNDMLDDLRFANGEQWPQDLRGQREIDGRPCLTINKVPTFADQVIGDIRQNEPSGKIRAVDSFADPKTAEILTGLIRNIENQSDAEIAYDTAAESAVYCGLGAFRIGTEYSEDDTFDQNIKIYRIKNPFTIHWDPMAQNWDKSDAQYCFITEKISREEYKRLYPKSSMSSFEGNRDKDPYWGDNENIRLVEYFKKVPTTKKLYLLKSMQSGEMFTHSQPPPDPENWQIIKERDVETYDLKWWKANHAEILEGGEKGLDWPGKYIPIVMVYGKEIIIEGRSIFRGIVRNAKDAQKLYNYSRSTAAEVISLAPKSPYIVTAKMISNYQDKWDNANKRNYVYLPYDVDPSNPQAIPKRTEPISVNTGIQAEIITADQELHDTTGLQLASLGKKSNEKSGRAIIARQREGDVANFAYYDNLGRGIKYGWKILIDLIPKIYDNKRIVRILGEDQTEQFVPINQQFIEQGADGDSIQRIYDLTVGKYDVALSIGPSYTTQREEAAENMLALIQAAPQIAPIIADLIVKYQDWYGAPEIAKRLKLLLPPQLQSGDGGQPSQPSPPPPSPMEMIAIKGQAAKVQGQEIQNEAAFNKMQMEKIGGPKQ